MEVPCHISLYATCPCTSVQMLRWADFGMNIKCQVSAGICWDAQSFSYHPCLHCQVSCLPTVFAAKGKFIFLSALLKHIVLEFVGGWQSTKKQSRDIHAKAGGLWASELKCYFRVAPLVNHKYVCGFSMTEQRGSMLQIFQVAKGVRC